MQIPTRLLGGVFCWLKVFWLCRCFGYSKQLTVGCPCPIGRSGLFICCYRVPPSSNPASKLFLPQWLRFSVSAAQRGPVQVLPWRRQRRAGSCRAHPVKVVAWRCDAAVSVWGVAPERVTSRWESMIRNTTVRSTAKNAFSRCEDRAPPYAQH